MAYRIRNFGSLKIGWLLNSVGARAGAGATSKFLLEAGALQFRNTDIFKIR
jgi:hypothetical protein